MIELRQSQENVETVMIFLKSILKKEIPNHLIKCFPFCVPTISSFSSLDIHKPVTFFVGENGSGKSTLLEAIAAHIQLPIIGSSSTTLDPTLKHARNLARYLSLSWSERTHQGFFLRAEDFFGFIKMVTQLKTQLRQDIQETDENLPDGYGKDLAIGALKGQIRELTQRYGVDPDAYSHGESFLQLFQSRLKPHGIYLLDEPETPLSPTKQMSLLILIDQMVKKNCQFIIATHSPILMAYPNAQILDFDCTPVQVTEFQALRHVQLMRDFLHFPEKFLKELEIT